jgi:hypothetical protein
MKSRRCRITDKTWSFGSELEATESRTFVAAGIERESAQKCPPQMTAKLGGTGSYDVARYQDAFECLGTYR